MIQKLFVPAYSVGLILCVYCLLYEGNHNGFKQAWDQNGQKCQVFFQGMVDCRDSVWEKMAEVVGKRPPSTVYILIKNGFQSLCR